MYAHRMQNFKSMVSIHDFKGVSPDGRTMMSCISSKVVFSDTKSGKVLSESLDGHHKGVTCVSWSPDGRYIASSGLDASVRVWDTIFKGNVIVFRENVFTQTCVAWSPNSKYLASGSDVCVVRIWNIETQKIVFQMSPCSNASITSISWSPDGKFIVIGDTYGIIRIVCLESHTLYLKFSLGNNTVIYSVAFSPQENIVAILIGDEHLHFVSPVTGCVLFRLVGHSSKVLCAAWCKDGKYIASGSDDGCINIWDTCTRAITKSFISHQKSIVCISWSGVSNQIISCCSDNKILVWQPNDTIERNVELCYGSNKAKSVSWSPNDVQFVCNSGSEVLKYDCRTGEMFPLFGHGSPVAVVAWAPCSMQVATADKDATIRTWKVGDNRHTSCFLLPNGSRVRCMRWSSNSIRLAVATYNGMVFIWNVLLCRVERKIFEPSTLSITCLRWLKSDKEISIYTSEKTSEQPIVYNVDLCMSVISIFDSRKNFSQKEYYVFKEVSPDGKSLLFFLKYARNQTYHIRLVNIETQQCTNYRIPYRVQAFKWSFDGNKVLLSCTPCLFVLHLRSSTMFEYIIPFLSCYEVFWMNNNNQILLNYDAEVTDNRQQTEKTRVVHLAICKWTDTTNFLFSSDLQHKIFHLLCIYISQSSNTEFSFLCMPLWLNLLEQVVRIFDFHVSSHKNCALEESSFRDGFV